MSDPFSSLDPSDIPTAMAVLNHIASGETSAAPGQGYDEIYGGGKFNSFSAHPNVHIPIGNGQFTGAAGRYQFEPATWDSEASKLGLTNFSPDSQDQAAWDLAKTTYFSQTGKDLLSDAKTGKVDWPALGEQWTSLAKDSPGAAGPTGTGDSSVGSASAGSLQPSMQPGNGLGAANVPGSGPAGGSSGLALLGQLAPHLTFSPVDYDPFKVEQGAQSS